MVSSILKLNGFQYSKQRSTILFNCYQFVHIVMSYSIFLSIQIIFQHIYLTHRWNSYHHSHQGGSGSNGNDEVLHSPQSSRTGNSPLDSVYCTILDFNSLFLIWHWPSGTFFVFLFLPEYCEDVAIWRYLTRGPILLVTDVWRKSGLHSQIDRRPYPLRRVL